jgi:ABC-type glycerol-3-phosphate transport system substrate-binding protein
VWDNYDGQLVAQATQPKYKDYLAYMRSLHDDGVFAPGALTGSSDLWKEHMFNSVAGMWFHSITRIDEYFMRNMMKANPDWEARGIEIVMAKPPLADDGRGGPTMGSPVSRPVFITVAAEDPDRVFEYLVNVFTNPQWLEFAKWGLEGKHHLLENGRKVRHPDGLTDDRYLQLKGMVFLQSKYPLDDEDVLYHYGERALRAHQFGAQYNRKPDLSLIGKPVLDEEKEHSNLGDIKLEYSMKIIRGDLTLDEGWDRMQQAMEAAGLPRVQAAVQQWYDANR